MDRTLENLIKRVREELRAEGESGGGYSDFSIKEHLNAAINELSGIYAVRDVIEITAQEGVNTYTQFDCPVLEKIIKVEYDGRTLTAVDVDYFSGMTGKDEGQVDKYFFWGKALTLIGEVEEAKAIKMWITRIPNTLADNKDVSELPAYTDEAVINYAIAGCCRESRDYDRAQLYYNMYLHKRNELLRRGVPQRQRDLPTKMRDTYWPPVGRSTAGRKSDTNPGGN